MNDEIAGLILKADAFFDKKDYAGAGRCYEQVAAAAAEKKVEFLIKAAQAYEKILDANAKRCYYQASRYAEKDEKAGYILACWRVCIAEIAGYEWECSFAWSGDDSHDDDHDMYQSLIEKTKKEAENYLREALIIAGVNSKRILKEAQRECERRGRIDGWGASRCKDTITNVKK